MRNSLNFNFLLVLFCFNIYSPKIFMESFTPKPKFYHMSKNACINTSLAPFLRENSLWEENDLIIIKECLKERRSLGRAQGAPSHQDYMLPYTINPIHYLVKICPMIREPFTFSGYVEIDIEAKVPTREIELNMLDINITSLSLKEQNGSNSLSIKVKNINKLVEKVFFESKDRLQVGKLYTLAIEFNGTVRSDRTGLYKSVHQNEHTNKSYVSLVTQFQTTDARRMFPCFDEPRFRSYFTFIVCRDKSLKAISNMPKLSTVADKGKENMVWDQFEKSPPMPTYLLSIAILDDFEFKVCESPSTKINVWAPTSKKEITRFACRMSIKFIKFFEDYFNFSFMFPKLDMLPVSETLMLGMENFGIPIFQINRLLVNESDINSLINQNDAADTISHEIVHHWMGNLVSPDGWPYLWISESLTTFLSLLAIENIKPEWHIFKSKLFYPIRSIMREDSTTDAIPMVNEAHTRDELRIAFSPQMVYFKGGLVVRMISHILSADVFKQAMRKYISETQFKSVSQDKLANTLTKVARKSRVLSINITMKDIIDTWTLQPGYPVVNVQRYDNGTLALSQKRFYQNPNEKSKNPNPRTKWWIPLTIATKLNPAFNDTSPKFWMNSYNHSWHLGELSQPDNWYVLNVQQMGYFRVNYDERNWRALIQQMRTDPLVFDEITRAHIVDDCFALANAKELNYKIPYDILYLKNEPSIFVLNAVVDFLTVFSHVYQTKEIKEMQKIALPLLLQHYPKGGLLNRSLELPYVRDITNKLIRIVCSLYQPCIDEAMFIYNQFTIKNSSFIDAVDPFLLQFISNLRVEFSSQKNRTELYKKYSLISDIEDKKNFLHILTASEDGKEVERLLNILYLEAQKTESSQFLTLGMQHIAKIPQNTQYAWDYLKRIWPQFEGSSNEADLFSAVVPYLWTETQYKELKEFIKTSMGSSSISRKLAKRFVPKIKNKVTSFRLKSIGLKSWLKSRRGN